MMKLLYLLVLSHLNFLNLNSQGVPNDLDSKVSFTRSFISANEILSKKNSTECFWRLDDLVGGEYFRFLNIKLFESPYVNGQKIYVVNKIGDELVGSDGNHLVLNCSHSHLIETKEQFLVVYSFDSVLFVSSPFRMDGLSAEFLSGYSVDELVKLRLFYWECENVKKISEDNKTISFTANSRRLGGKICIEINKMDMNKFSIWTKGRRKFLLN